VGVNGREAGRLAEGLAKLRAAVPDGAFVPVAAGSGTAEGAEPALRELPEVDILVHNLGVSRPRRRSTTSGAAASGSTSSRASGRRAPISPG
jgi:hypothetical protein